MKSPRIRKDKICALRTCKEPLPELAEKYGDPFHSAECARAYHGQSLAPTRAAPKTRKPLTARQERMMHNSAGKRNRPDPKRRKVS